MSYFKSISTQNNWHPFWTLSLDVGKRSMLESGTRTSQAMAATGSQDRSALQYTFLQERLWLQPTNLGRWFSHHDMSDILTKMILIIGNTKSSSNITQRSSQVPERSASFFDSDWDWVFDFALGFGPGPGPRLGLGSSNLRFSFNLQLLSSLKSQFTNSYQEKEALE